MKVLSKRIKDQRGFNLIELMIVIAIIGLLIGVGSIAWSAVIKSGNETAAAQMLDRIRTYQASFASRNHGDFGTFDDLIKASGLDEKFAGENPVVNGYKFTMVIEPASSNAPAKYSINADPQVSTGMAATGNRHFFTSSSIGSIKSQPKGEDRPALETDESI